MPQNYDEQVHFFEQAIDEHKTSIRLACLLSAGVVTCGIIAAIFINFTDSVNGYTKTISTVAACFSTLFSGFPLRDFPSQRNKIKMLRTFISRYQRIEQDPAKAAEFEIDKLQEIYWSLVKKTAGA
jgi:hypothetical protein